MPSTLAALATAFTLHPLTKPNMPTKQITSRLLLVVPYWDGDKADAMRSLIQATELIKDRSDEIGLLIVYRYDSTPPSDSDLRFFSTKFRDVKVWRCDRRGKGYPMGPNEMYFGTFQYVRDPKSRLSDYEAILVMESDCVMIREDWHREMIKVWQDAKTNGKLITGAVIENGYDGYPRHVNAAAIYYRKIGDMTPLLSSDGNLGWDWVFGRQLMPFTQDSPAFQLKFKQPTIGEEEMEDVFDSPVVMLHGIKDDSVIQAVKRRYFNPRKEPMTIQQFASGNGWDLEGPADDGSYRLIPSQPPKESNL